MKNPLAKHISNANRKIRLKLTYQVPITIKAGAAIQFPQLIIPLNYPNICLKDDGSGVAALDYIAHDANNKIPDIYTKFLDSANPLFDTYKVQSLEVMYMPNNFDVNTLATQLTTNNSLVMYHFNELDDATLLTQPINQMLNDGVMPINFNITSKKGVRFVYKQLKTNKKFYLNTNLICNHKVPVPTDQQTYGSGAFPNSFGSMKLCWQVLGQAAASYLGQAIISWDVIFKGIPSLL